MATNRPIPFVLVSSNHGSLIVNRNDYRMVGENKGYGVGYQILNTSSFDHYEINFVLALINLRRKHFGDGVLALDCGANIGVHTIEWAKLMHGWGRVIAFEAQEKVYYALAGNIAINNCLNATAHWAALGSECGKIKIPVPDYLKPASFGSLELKQKQGNEFIGQTIDYSDSGTQTVNMLSIDSFELPRVDLMKIDVEGMEVDVLEGAKETIARCKPMLTVEIIKTDKTAVTKFLTELGYSLYPMGINLLAVHNSDPAKANLSIGENGALNLTV